jgi:hypothetical protein
MVFKFPVTTRSKPIVIGVPPVLARKTNPDLNFLQSIVLPADFSLGQRYFAIEILPPELIDDEKSYVIAGDSQSLMAILMSSFYPIWVRAVGKSDQKKINPSMDYNNFPFPEFSKKQEKLLEEAGGRIHRARGSLKGSTLSEAYKLPRLPDHLVMAHEELDRVVKGIFGLPESATEEEIAQKLFDNYMVLFQKT